MTTDQKSLTTARGWVQKADDIMGRVEFGPTQPTEVSMHFMGMAYSFLRLACGITIDKQELEEENAEE